MSDYVKELNRRYREAKKKLEEIERQERKKYLASIWLLMETKADRGADKVFLRIPSRADYAERYWWAMSEIEKSGFKIIKDEGMGCWISWADEENEE